MAFSAKRPVMYVDDYQGGHDYSRPKRSRPPSRHPEPHFDEAGQTRQQQRDRSPSPLFFTIREHSASPRPALERTASGLAISPALGEADCICASTELLEDVEAAQRVQDHLRAFRRRCPDSKHERILRSVVSPRSPDDAAFAIDNAFLESIFSAANAVFFNGRLTQRVAWDWSHASSLPYGDKVIGTTALRRASRPARGLETLIVLSSPILRDTRFNRRLLISTFLHELIHSYLFICCGFRARQCGGHTPGFRAIAKLIDDWAGDGNDLHLCEMEADLDNFQRDEPPPLHLQHHQHPHPHQHQQQHQHRHHHHQQQPTTLASSGYSKSPDRGRRPDSPGDYPGDRLRPPPSHSGSSPYVYS